MLAKPNPNATFSIQSRGRALSLISMLVLLMGYLLMHELSGAWDAPAVEVNLPAQVPTIAATSVPVAAPTPLRPSSGDLLELDLPFDRAVTPIALQTEMAPLLEPVPGSFINDLSADGENPLRIGTRPTPPPR